MLIHLFRKHASIWSQGNFDWDQLAKIHEHGKKNEIISRITVAKFERDFFEN